uniref:Nucleotidyltransferase domain-containing protein n=1 Tax=Candidatus Kentrum sp. SD TaxID=2126332 RepID=A0A450YF38_9GAMM|nr:MAG: Nucleotidyltransferase domain-containing protein [Candidatus Kentron sp. SD]VFK45474.1 MAG: Nucleotidyltransferase domain-containing protein [Candidatus Kentron sp. SD]
MPAGWWLLNHTADTIGMMDTIEQRRAGRGLDIDPRHHGIVRDILHRHVPDYAVWAFGSRAVGSARPYSDLDLAIITERPLPFAVVGELSEAFAESDLPWRVDIVDWAVTSAAFREIIARDKVIVRLPGSRGSWEAAT